jgi:magnesium-transporting ATPase (P-type)
LFKFSLKIQRFSGDNQIMDTRQRKKRSLLINPKFQWTLIGYAAVTALLVLFSVYGLFTFGFSEFNNIGNQAGLPPDHIYFQFIKMQEATFLRVIAAIAVVIGLILTVGGLILSHKIAGPIYRMQKEFNGMSGKDPLEIKEIQFRKGDFFPELADSFNVLVKKWNAARASEADVEKTNS